MQKNIIIYLFILLNVSFGFADSPLTSTKIADAYKNNDYVKVAIIANGSITMEIMDNLTNKYIPIDIKIAIINALGWQMEGQNNYNTFVDYLIEKKFIKSRNHINNASADILLCMAYVKAMDNYFDVKDAIKLAEQALKKSPKSYTFNIITALIKAQDMMDDDWCHVYHLTNDVRCNNSLNIDMNQQAIDLIFLYMDAYGNYCK